MAQFTVNPHALRSVQELQVPREVGRPLRRRRQQGRRAQAHHRGGRAPRGRRSEHQPQVARPHQVRGDHARARRHARPGVRAAGPTRCGTSAPGSARRSRSRTSARTSSSRSTTRPARWCSRTRSTAAGCPSSRRCPTSTPTPTPSRSRHIKLENEGWERDVEVAEPAEPTLHRAGVSAHERIRHRRAAQWIFRRRHASREAGVRR